MRFSLFLVLLFPVMPLWAQDEGSWQGYWRGTLHLPNGGNLDLGMTILHDVDAFQARINIPAQGLKDYPLTDFQVEGSRMTATVAGIAGAPQFSGERTEESIGGHLLQAGQRMPFTLHLESREVTGDHLNSGGPPPRTDDPALGYWKGTLRLPQGDVVVTVHLTGGKRGWSGSADLSSHQVTDFPLSEIRREEGRISFAWKGLPGSPGFDGAVDGDRIDGVMKMGEEAYPLVFHRMAGPHNARPQTPQAPFPYDVEELQFQNGPITLAGTLTLPRGEGPFPAVILISGSGPQDRDHGLFDHKPFWVMADRWTRAGIAVLRYDDRGVGGSSGDVFSETSADFARDVLAGVSTLNQHPRINSRAIGVMGHSEGGLVAPLAAAQSSEIAFVVMLAGLGVPGHEILQHQTELINAASGLQGEALQKANDLQKKIIALLREEKPAEDTRQGLRRLLAERAALSGGPADPAQVPEGGLDFLTSPWFRFFLDVDPRESLRRIQVPILVLNGGLDLQVDPRQNLPEIEKALREAGNKDVTIKELPDLNHLFQPAKSGLPTEYGAIEVSFDPATLRLIEDWILKRFGR